MSETTELQETKAWKERAFEAEAQLTAALQENERLKKARDTALDGFLKAAKEVEALESQLASGAEQMTNLSLLLEKAEGDRSRLSASLKSEKERGDRLAAARDKAHKFLSERLEDSMRALDVLPVGGQRLEHCGRVHANRTALALLSNADWGAALSGDTPTTQPPVLSEEG